MDKEIGHIHSIAHRLNMKASMNEGARKIQSLERQLETLQHRVRELEVDNRRLAVRNSLDKEAVKQRNAEKALEEARVRIRGLEEAISGLERHCASLQYEVNMLRGVVDLESTPDCVLTAADALAQVAELEEAQRESNAKLESEKQALQICLLRLSAREEELAVVTEREQAIRAAEERARKEAESLSEELRGLRVSTARLADANNKSTEKVDQLIVALDEAHAEARAAQESLEQNKLELSRAQSELDKVRRSWEAGHSAFSQSQSLLFRANEKVAELDELSERIRRVTSEKLELETRLERALATCERLRRERMTLRQEAEMEKSRNLVLLSEKNTLADALRKSEKENIDLRERVPNFQKQITELEAAQEAALNEKRGLEEYLWIHQTSQAALEERCQQLSKTVHNQNLELSSTRSELSKANLSMAVVSALRSSGGALSTSGLSAGLTNSLGEGTELAMTPGPRIAALESSYSTPHRSLIAGDTSISSRDESIIHKRSVEKLNRLLGL